MASQQKLFFPPLSSIQHDPPKTTPIDEPVGEIVDDELKEVDRGLVPVEDIGEDRDVGGGDIGGTTRDIDKDNGDTEDVGSDAGDIGNDEAMESIIDELKKLQDSNNDLHKQLEVSMLVQLYIHFTKLITYCSSCILIILILPPLFNLPFSTIYILLLLYS